MPHASRAPLFAAGASPFRARGNLWLGIRQFVDEQVPGGMDAVSSRLDAGERAFFTDKFVPSGWYDLMPVLRVAQAIATTMGVGIVEYQRRSAVWHAERDMRGAYAPVLQRDTPEAVCLRFSSIYALLYDFGRAEVVRQEPRCIHACCYGMPEPLAGWWMRASEGYMDPVLRAAGAKNPRLVWSPLEPDGERSGVTLVRIPSRTVWD